MHPRRGSDPVLLRKEREVNALPFSVSPFVHPQVQESGEDGKPEQELRAGELRVKAPTEVPWIDLLLEIAMTTAFASLTDGTPILQWHNALSYVAYFVFVWWIWVSQVAYNLRFRQADWLHRIWVFAQLVIFSALAAFTKDFDVTNGLWGDPDEALTNKLWTQAGTDSNQLAAFDFRDKRLPRLNAKGVSAVMGISRLLLLLQYTIVFYHARGLKRTSLVVHMVPLVFSSLCYFAAFVMQGSTDSRNFVPSHIVQIVKLVLWYFPILVEISSHIVALNLPGFVKYSTKSIYSRSSTVFLVILGSGLDKITSGFKTIVGNAGLASDGIPIFIATAVAFIGFFSLYFGTPGNTLELGNRRALVWLYSHFFFLAPLIVALEGIANSLAFSNLNTALVKSDGALAPMFEWMNNHPGSNLTVEGFNSSEFLFNRLGLGMEGIVDDLNYFVGLAQTQNDSNVITAGQLVEEVAVFQYILNVFDALPDQDSLIAAKLGNFLSSDFTNTTVTAAINRPVFEDIYDGILKDRGSSALWLYPAAGSTVLALVLMSFVKAMPRDKWEWGVIVTRIFIGGGICCLSFLDIGSSKPIFDSQGKLTDCIIWVITVGPRHLLLIILATSMGVLQIIEHSIAYAANRPYQYFPGLDFLLNGSERRPTEPRPAYHYQRTYTNADTIPLTPSFYSDRKASEPLYTDPYGEFNPYHEFEASENTLYSRRG